MSKTDEKSKPPDKKSPPKSHDLITFTPHLIINIDEKQRFLINEHLPLINGLRQENLTVKDMHILYFNTEENKFDKTLKTVYRYVRVLVDAGILKVAGKRMTESSRVTENIYSLTSNYFHDAKPTLEWWTGDESKNFASKLGFILSEVLGNAAFNQATSIDTIHKLCKLSAELDYFNILEIIENSKKNPKVDDTIAENYFEDQSLITFASRLIGLIRNFELIEDLKDISEFKIES
ncbi:MAG: hypothetical protein ACXAD7_01625 [Candidatus Kariarchaeaceae archaeon]|jgi:hypothetical protein